LRPARDVRFHRPTIYQETAGARREVSGRYVFKKVGEVGFEVGDYDPETGRIPDAPRFSNRSQRCKAS
jgi:hypothetical protein